MKQSAMIHVRIVNPTSRHERIFKYEWPKSQLYFIQIGEGIHLRTNQDFISLFN